MQDRYTLREAAAVLGVDYEKLKTDARRGKFPVITDDQKKKTRYITLETLLALRNGKQADRYHELVDQYLAELTAGTISRRPATQGYRDDMEGYLKRFWTEIKQTASITRITPDNLRACYTAIGFNQETRQDYHAVKVKIHRAVSGFSRLLLREGVISREQHAAIMATKPPGKKYEKGKQILSPAMVDEAIRFNESWVAGRQKVDRYCMGVLVHLYAYAGIRKMEAAQLELGDVDFARNSLRVWGKGGKRRIIPMVPKLKAVLYEWVTCQRPESETNLLVVNNRGQALNSNAINDKFNRLSKAHKRRIMPHALRHACATILANEGMPVPLIQRLLGHSDITTTQIYLDTTDQDLFNWMAKQKPVKQASKKAYI